MKLKGFSARFAALIIVVGVSLPLLGHGQGATVNDDFTQANDANSWKTFGGACLTAGDGSGSIPSCVGLPYYKNQVQVGGSMGYLGNSSLPGSGAAGVQTPDAAGSGALRLTNGNNTKGKSGFSYGYNQAGAIISSGTPFDNSAGVNIIFKTIAYRGDGANGDGADGMGFFLMDGAQSPYDVGAFGGSLGYSCSNTNNDPTLRPDTSVRAYDGLAYGYLGLGMDEYGNFLNAGDNTVTGPNQTPGRIGLRGAGSVTWGWLSNNYPGMYPSSLKGTSSAAQAVQNTCKTGRLWNYGPTTAPDGTPAGMSDGGSLNPHETTITVPDYGIIPGASLILSAVLPGKKIAAESANTRGAATPITYNLKITQAGDLSLFMAYGNGAYIPVISNASITASNGAPPATFRFGFTGSTGGSTNVHEVLCFQASPASVAGTSVGVNQQEATKIATGTQAYLANYYPATWTGDLTSSNILYDSTNQTVSISSTANWDAQCNLTGIKSGATCASTGTAGVVVPQAYVPSASTAVPLSRSMITYDGTQGVAFEWDPTVSGTALSAAQQSTLDMGDTFAGSPNSDRLLYLRGQRRNEINSLSTGEFRRRTGILGDIIDSSPVWVGPPASAYSATWADKIVSSDTMSENAGTQTYSAFIRAQQSRLNVVYDGANDGFLHAFRSGSYDSGGNYVNNATTPNDGQEVLAYMPYLVTQNIHNSTDTTQDYSSASYSHNYFVDATPGTGDLFYGGTWHTWLTGGLGAGGAGIYVLDITNPTNFSEGNAASLVIGDWTASTLTCNQAVAACGTNNLGNTYGTPVIRRLHDGNWGVIFGNGFGSASGDAGIFIMIVNGTSGAISSTYYLSTGTGGTSNPNGIAFVTPVDIDTDHVVDYVYAGDLLGNVWRFDLTSSSESAWAVSANSPLFTTAGGQPITTRMVVAIQPQTGGAPQLLVEFGTGQKFPLTNLNPVSYQPGSQALYGIWDWDMSGWNALGSKQLASLAAPQTVSSTNLQTQTLTLASGMYSITANSVCWKGSTACTGGASANTQFGWKVALPGANEQVVFSPLLYQNAFIVNTTIPANNSPVSCTVVQDSGNTIAISVASGGVVPGFFKNTTATNAAGATTGGTGTPFMLQAGGQSFMLTQTNQQCSGPNCTPPKIFSCATNPTASYCTTKTGSASPTGKRLTWVERR